MTVAAVILVLLSSRGLVGFHIASDGQCLCARLCVHGHSHRLGEVAHTVGVVLHFDGGFLARHDRLLWPLRHCATATSLSIADHQRLFARVGELELGGAVTALLDGAEIVSVLGELGTGLSEAESRHQKCSEKTG